MYNANEDVLSKRTIITCERCGKQEERAAGRTKHCFACAKELNKIRLNAINARRRRPKDGNDPRPEA